MTVPTNLKDGDYILQMMAVAGNSKDALYSCSKLSIFGGDTSLNCPVPNTIPSTVDCVKAGSPDTRALLQGVSPGSFCFNFNGVNLFFLYKFYTKNF